MGVIKAEVLIDAPPSEVFEMARRVEDYPDFMPDVEEVEILSRDDITGIARVRWLGKVEIQSIRKKVRWVEEEIWDSDKLAGKFSLIEGDYKTYGGNWGFEKVDDGKTRLTLELDFDLGLPLVGPIINKLLDKLMLTNCQGMLDAIKKRVES
jgi:ribosome-associated toxin RatA of RatAB toxin-antitoxin module